MGGNCIEGSFSFSHIMLSTTWAKPPCPLWGGLQWAPSEPRAPRVPQFSTLPPEHTHHVIVCEPFGEGVAVLLSRRWNAFFTRPARTCSHLSIALSLWTNHIGSHFCSSSAFLFHSMLFTLTGTFLNPFIPQPTFTIHLFSLVNDRVTTSPFSCAAALPLGSCFPPVCYLLIQVPLLSNNYLSYPGDHR